MENLKMLSKNELIVRYNIQESILQKTRAHNLVLSSFLVAVIAKARNAQNNVIYDTPIPYKIIENDEFTKYLSPKAEK
ncbi:hypothetical protein [Flavobacterium gelatinilyticum]|uniref:hypothetical protein n=1 Tax=Flavobacterium gelatinilyticum TaxID=3003260 RepID=UPI0024802B60|nr:hypothetical protein [Flavobacterium gelatinilyticum]